MTDGAGTVFRVPQPADVTALAELGRTCFTASFGHLYPSGDLAAFLDETHADPVVARRIADPARLYRVADRGGTLVGFAQLLMKGGNDYPTAAERPATLQQLYCAPGMTGGGTGSRLMDWALAEARARGADELRLSVWSENFGAQRFYRRRGFVHVADIDFWVGATRDHEFLYALRL